MQEICYNSCCNTKQKLKTFLRELGNELNISQFTIVLVESQCELALTTGYIIGINRLTLTAKFSN